MPSEETLRELAALCDERGIRLFCDEVYRGIEVDRERPLPQAADLSETALSLNVASKSYGLPGLRVGWVCCRDRELLARMASVKDYLSICGSAPSEYLAVCALSAREAILDRLNRLLAHNRRLLSDFFLARPEQFHFTAPGGGLTAFPGLRRGTADDFCQALLAATGVLLLPGSLYGETWAKHFRIGFGRADFAENLERLAVFCQNWLPGTGDQSA